MTRLLPNLYKQYFVQTQSEKARVINPNAVLEARTAKILERQREEQKHQEELLDQFEAGIIGEDTKFVEVTDTKEQLEQATNEAKKILEDARTQADTILNNAYHEAKNMCEEAKVQGYADGNAAMQKELQEMKAKLAKEYEDLRYTLEESYTNKRETMEQDLVTVILDVFNKVFHIQFDNKKHILMHLINDAILNIEGDRKFRIKVADSNVLFLENHREDILERVGHGIELEFIADSTMDGNDCLIETDSGVFDCSLGTQLENLIKDIRSLCS